MPDAWSPYAHEAARHALLRRRRGIVVGAIVVLALGWLGWATFTGGAANIDVSGSQGGSQITFDTEDRPKDKPLTIGLRPGGTAVMDTPLDTSGAEQPRLPQNRGLGGFDEPYAYTSLVIVYGPVLAAAYLVWRFWRSKPGTLDELNFGIYKGALPLEMLTASSRELVYTSRPAGESIFGKSREDYVQESAAPEARRLVLFESIRDGTAPDSSENA